MSVRDAVVAVPRPTPLPAPPLPTAADASWALFLDVDGTLLEFADDPSAVVVGAALGALLRDLHAALGGALALVSGRTVAELERLFGAAPWPLAGLHGAELRLADGRLRASPVPAAQQAAMRTAVRALAARHPGVRIEDKGVALALHCRGVPDGLAALRADARTVAATLAGYAVQPGQRVVEFKPAGVDKGQAVDALLQLPPFAGRRPVYVGDDLTDEHAFAAVQAAGGLGVRVGVREPTQADSTLPDPAAVERWLRRVLAALQRREATDA